MGCSKPLATISRRLAALVCGATLVACSAGDRGGEIGDRPDAELVRRFESEAVAWIRAERQRERPLAAPLSDGDVRRFAPYFSSDLLERVRVRSVPGFENPAFFSIFEAAGEPYPLDFRRARALALVDTILIAVDEDRRSRRESLLFHELVHVMQFEVLGLEGYMAGYVESWAGNGRGYRGIAHERQAFELATRFATQADPFSVEAEVMAAFPAPSASSTAAH